MSEANRDIQAGHQIIRLFEQSKTQTETTLDTIPGIFCVCGLDGIIYRGNDDLARTLKTSRELLLGQSLCALFANGGWSDFQNRLHDLFAGEVAHQHAEFELNVTIDGQPRNFVWQILPLDLGSNADLKLVTVLGRDVTALNLATSEKARLEVELETTSTVQRMFLPQISALSLGGVNIDGFYRPAAECGGDWWWRRVAGPNRLQIFMGDVTGHGAHAAMVTAIVATCFKVFENQGGTIELRAQVQSVHEVLFDILKGEYNMPSIAIEIDTTTLKVQGWSASAPNLIRLSPVAKPETIIFGATTPLGLRPELLVYEFNLQLNKGERLMLATDGMTEQVMTDGRLLGERRFLKILEGLTTVPTPMLVSHIVQEVDRLRDDVVQGDDFTFVIVDVP